MLWEKIGNTGLPLIPTSPFLSASPLLMGCFCQETFRDSKFVFMIVRIYASRSAYNLRSTEGFLWFAGKDW